MTVFSLLLPHEFCQTLDVTVHLVSLTNNPIHFIHFIEFRKCWMKQISNISLFVWEVIWYVPILCSWYNRQTEEKNAKISRKKNDDKIPSRIEFKWLYSHWSCAKLAIKNIKRVEYFNWNLIQTILFILWKVFYKMARNRNTQCFSIGFTTACTADK